MKLGWLHAEENTSLQAIYSVCSNTPEPHTWGNYSENGIEYSFLLTEFLRIQKQVSISTSEKNDYGTYYFVSSQTRIPWKPHWRTSIQSLNLQLGNLDSIPPAVILAISKLWISGLIRGVSCSPSTCRESYLMPNWV